MLGWTKAWSQALSPDAPCESCGRKPALEAQLGLTPSTPVCVACELPARWLLLSSLVLMHLFMDTHLFLSTVFVITHKLTLYNT